MAQATIPHTAPTRLPSKRKPDPARVVQSYFHIVQTQGERGARQKTGEIYGISRETVRRYVDAHEAAQDVPEVPEELIYTPPPGGYPEPVMPRLAHTDASYVAPVCIHAARTDEDDCAELMSSANFTDQAEPQESVVATPETAHGETAQLHRDELETRAVAAPETAQPPIVYRDRIVRERVVVRVPVERQTSGMLSLVADHLPPVQVLVAVLIALALVGVASLG